MAKRDGTLVYDPQTERCVVRFNLSEYYEGLRCGECFDVLIGGNLS